MDNRDDSHVSRCHFDELGSVRILLTSGIPRVSRSPRKGISMTTSRVALGLMVVFLMGLGAPIAAADAAEFNGIYTEASNKDVGESTKLDVLKGLKFRGWIDTYFAGDFSVFRKATMSPISDSLKIPCVPQGGITVSGL